MKTKLFLIQIFIISMLVTVTNSSAQTLLDVKLNVQEQDQWCWAACSKAILNYYGKNVSQCEIAEYTRTVSNWNNFGSANCCGDPTKGCNYWNYNWGAPGSIEDILNHWGVQDNTYGKALSLSEINTEIANGHPFVVRWGWYSGGGHFVVGHGVSGNTVYYMNPWPGEGLKFADYNWLVDDGSHLWTHTNTMVTAPPPPPSTIDVSLIAPVNNANYNAPATINLTANASVNTGTISKVEFYNGTTLLGSDETSPYSFSWSSVVAGNYSLTAKAYNNLSASKSSSIINVKVNGLPSVSITSPANNATFTAPASITINATAIDSDGSISKVEFYNGSTLLGIDNTSPYSFTWTNVAVGTYTIMAKAYDNLSAATTSSTKNIIVNTPSNSLPVVSITSPSEGSVFTSPANIVINANASDSDGSISYVEFYNGGTLLGTDNSSPYSFNYSNVAAGTYTLSAKAYDNLNAVSNAATVTFSVKNPGNIAPSVTVTSPVNYSSYSSPANIIINADAIDSDGSISYVEFYSGGTVLGVDNTSPYSFNFTNVAPGTYTLFAKAFDNLSAASNSTSVIVTVNAPAVNAAPVVNIVSPVNNSTFTSPANISINADATDSDGSVSKVEFYNGSAMLGYDITAPYSLTLTGVAVGTYSITAKAYDNLNATSNSAIVLFTVNAPVNSAPVVTLVSPVNNSTFTAPANITINADATDSDGSVSKVEFYNGSAMLGYDNTAPYSLTLTGVSVGTYSITAKAYDNLNATSNSATVLFTVNAPVNSAPIVTLVSPVNNSTFTAPANITINADATDSDGSVSKVEFYNGSALLGYDNTSPYSLTWSGVAVGTYTITAKAYDNLNASTSSTSITLIVTNSGTCTAVQWDPKVAYVGGNVVQYAGVKYQANWWTMNERPDLNYGVQYSGKPWTNLGTCTSKMSYITDSEPKTISVVPNPMDYSSVVHLNLLEDDDINIFIVDELGRKVIDVYNGHVSSGEYQFEINSYSISPGLYHLIMKGEKGNIGLNIIKK